MRALLREEHATLCAEQAKLRDELRAEYNVAVHDRDGRWRLLEPTKRRLV